MDPLGAKPAIVDVDELPLWDETKVPSYDISLESKDDRKDSPFVFDKKINQKIVYWVGDLTQLNATAIVNSTNESMTDQNRLSEMIFQKAGTELRQEIRKSFRTCKTGEAKMTKAYNLPSRYVIHTVGPRYNIKYQTAAESALYNCYRNIMQLVREHKMSSLGLCCVHSARRSYPPEEGAHIALRTVRRFVEHYGDEIEKVVFVVTEVEEPWPKYIQLLKDIYTRLLPLYFPRSKEEQEYAAMHLPADVGDEFGEPFIKERQIRISDKLLAKSQQEDSDETEENLAEEFDSNVAIGQHAFAKMEADHDKNRALKLQGKATLESERNADQRRYARLVKRAKKEDLTDIAALRCLYQSGYDRRGRPIIVFVARYFAYNHIDLEKAILYLLQVMDPIVSQKYVVVYLHTATTNENQPSLKFLKEIYRLIDERYKQNLSAFYLVHPTFWSRILTWFFTTFTASHIKDKVRMIYGIEHLYGQINPDQLDVPPFVFDHDLQVNGARYYIPNSDTNDEIGEEL